MKYPGEASTNKNKGYKTHGSFKNSGQKDGSHGAKSKIGAQKKGYAKETEAKKDPVNAKLKKISKSMFFKRHASNPDALQRAQLNA